MSKRKFKVGDKVKVNKRVAKGYGFFEGEVGTVVEYSCPYYRVGLKTGTLRLLLGAELDKVEEE